MQDDKISIVHRPIASVETLIFLKGNAESAVASPLDCQKTLPNARLARLAC